MTWFGDLYFATSPPKVQAKDIRKLCELIQSGDIICRKYVYYLDSYFIPGTYSHSGIYIGQDTLVHAVAEGVSKIDIIDYVKDADGFVLLRPKEICCKQKLVDYAILQLGFPYDFLFNKADKSAFYCHELTASSLELCGAKMTIKNKYIYADDIITQCDVILEVQ